MSQRNFWESNNHDMSRWFEEARDKSATSSFEWNLGTSTTTRQTEFATSRTCRGRYGESRRNGI